MPRDKRPNSRRNLDIALDREFGGAGAAIAARTAMASVIVGQMLPNGVIKGGSALKIRFGYGETRYTSAGSDRARDLVDLQLIAGRGSLDLAGTREACESLFRSRHAQEWPVTVVPGEGWAAAYAVAAEGLGVLPDVLAAAEWANGLVRQICEA